MTVYSKPTVTIFLNEENLKAISLRSRTKSYPLSLHIFKRVLEILAREIRQLKKIKKIQIGREEIKNPYLQII